MSATADDERSDLAVLVRGQLLPDVRCSCRARAASSRKLVSFAHEPTLSRWSARALQLYSHQAVTPFIAEGRWRATLPS